jgi:phenylalanine-4-hydroxylase
VFGHVPMLADPVFADYMQAYGEGGLRALGFGRLHNLARLYWYTVEFGLLRTPDGLRIYGAGIVSSSTESRYSLQDKLPVRIGFSLPRVMRTPYVIDDVQKMYFVVDSLQTLLDVTQKTDFAPLYAELAKAEDIPIGTVMPEDEVFEMGG